MDADGIKKVDQLLNEPLSKRPLIRKRASVAKLAPAGADAMAAMAEMSRMP